MSEPEHVVISIRGCGFNAEYRTTPDRAEPLVEFLDYWDNGGENKSLVIGENIVRSDVYVER